MLLRMLLRRYPPEVRYYLDLLDRYDVVPFDASREWNIVHLYPKGLAYPDGYYHARFFDLWMFNTETTEKAVIERRDGLSLGEEVEVKTIQILADGSTIVEFRQPVKIHPTQNVVVERAVK